MQTEFRFPTESAIAHAAAVRAEAAFQKSEEARYQRMMRELQSDLADLVASGDLTEEEANQWANDKADQWFGGDR